MEHLIDIKLTTEKLNLQECYDFVQDSSCGGIAVFVGTVRNQSHHKKVLRLDFSSYSAMAIKELQKIAKRALEKFPIKLAIEI